MRGFSRRTLLLVALALLAAGCGGSSSASAGTIAYTALGASDAVGIGAVPLSKGYVPTLADDMRSAGFTVTLDNLGINGAHVGDIVDQELPQALADDPDVVTLWTGANDVVSGDSPDAFAAQLSVLLGALADGTHARVYVADLPDLTQEPLFRDGSDPDVTKARVDAFNDRIHAAVAAAGFVLVRLSDIPPRDDLVWVDGFHPNNAGHAAIADAFWAKIAPDL